MAYQSVIMSYSIFMLEDIQFIYLFILFVFGVLLIVMIINKSILFYLDLKQRNYLLHLKTYGIISLSCICVALSVGYIFVPKSNLIISVVQLPSDRYLADVDINELDVLYYRFINELKVKQHLEKELDQRFE